MLKLAVSLVIVSSLAGCGAAGGPDVNRMRAACPDLPDQDLFSQITLLEAVRDEGASKAAVLLELNGRCGQFGPGQTQSDCVACGSVIIDEIWP